MGLHQATRRKVYDAFVFDGPITPRKLAAFDRRTAQHVVRELGKAGWLQVLPDGGWAVGPAVGHVLVFDVGWRQIRLALCDAHGRVLKERRRPISLEPRHGNADSVKTLRSRVQGLTQELLEGNEALLIVGAMVVWPAAIPREPHRPVRAGLPQRAWRSIDLRQLFSDEINMSFTRARVPVFFQNDADAEALGEAHYGVGRGCRNLLLIKICEGIGAGLVVDGHVYEGADGKAGEIGHVVPNLPEGSEQAGAGRAPAKCTCGSQDHLESYASARAMIRALVADSDPASYEACIGQILSRRDEFVVRDVLERSGVIIGRTLWPLVQMLNPDRIVISSEPDDPTLFDNIVSSLKQGAVIDGERISPGTRGAEGELGMSLRGGALSGIREYLVPRLRHGILGEPWPSIHDETPVALATPRRPRVP
jgi:predicted NBD/HSP70 family sugar kinase